MDDLKTWLLEQHQKALLDGVAMGQQHEKARIIKLLEEHKMTYLPDEAMYCCDGGFQHAIALIKGETE